MPLELCTELFDQSAAMNLHGRYCMLLKMVGVSYGLACIHEVCNYILNTSRSDASNTGMHHQHCSCLQDTQQGMRWPTSSAYCGYT